MFPVIETTNATNVAAITAAMAAKEVVVAVALMLKN
jgi:hypothetical protein